MKLIFTLITTFFVFISSNDTCVADPHKDAMFGGKINEKDAGKLESSLAANEDDLSVRTKLLVYYFIAGQGRKDSIENRRKHIFWVIRNHPESKLAGLPYCAMRPHSDPEGYVDAKKLWIEQVAEHPKDSKVLKNAGEFFQFQESDLAKDFFIRAQKAEPKDPKLADKLGHFYSMLGEKEDAEKSLEQYERAQELDDEKRSKFYRLAKLAKAAFKVGNLEKAKSYAEKLIIQTKDYPKDWNYGNAIHHGNNVLGLCALEAGEVKLAGEYLIKAGKTPGSPQLDSFGPNMSLAKALLERGEKDVVLEYFALCGIFWKRGELDRWVRDVKAGNIPDFGGNLVY